MMKKIYERGLRFVMNDRSQSYEELLMLTICDTMFLWRLKKIAIFMYKCFYRLHLKYINNMFNVKEMPYSMRDDLKFILPKFNTKTYRYKLWNSLPVTFKKCTSIHVFLKNLEKQLLVDVICLSKSTLNKNYSYSYKSDSKAQSIII